MPFSKSHPDLALPPDSLILVSGASGFIANHVVQEALALGYRVRGTARTQSKADKTSQLFNSPNYSTAVVADMAQPGAFDEAIRDVDAVIHTASVMSFSPDPNQVIPAVVDGVKSILNSALNEPSVKRFVYTSSSTAATVPKPNKKFKIDSSVWNDEAVQQAWAPPPYENDRRFAVYSASKTEAERAVWDFVREKQPNFVVNCVCPNANLGRILDTAGATGDLVTSVYKGTIPDMPPQYMINVTDDARIHLAAVLDKTVANERIWAFDSPFNWNAVIDAIHTLRPDAKNLPGRIEGEGEDLSEPDNKLGGELLRKWWGQEGEKRRGYKGLVESVKENLEGLP